MTKYQKSLLNKISSLTAELQSDWELKAIGCQGMSRADRRKAEEQLNLLRTKFEATF